jgi:hypothetical protein
VCCRRTEIRPAGDPSRRGSRETGASPKSAYDRDAGTALNGDTLRGKCVRRPTWRTAPTELPAMANSIAVTTPRAQLPSNLSLLEYGAERWALAHGGAGGAIDNELHRDGPARGAPHRAAAQASRLLRADSGARVPPLRSQRLSSHATGSPRMRPSASAPRPGRLSSRRAPAQANMPGTSTSKLTQQLLRGYAALTHLTPCNRRYRLVDPIHLTTRPHPACMRTLSKP